MFNTDGYKTLKGLADALLQRQQILSNNLTNLDTKNYVRQDLDFSRVLSGLKNNTFGGDANEAILARARYRDFSNPTVKLESEMSKMYDNYMRYLLIVKSISHHYDHMRKALEVRAV